MLQILVQFGDNLTERVSGKQSSLNFESSLRFFSAEFWVEFSFSWIFLVEIQWSTFIYFYFLGSFIQEASDETNLLANFSCLYISVPEFVLKVRLVVLDKKEEVTFWCRNVWDYFSLLRPGQIKYRTWSAWFFLRSTHWLSGRVFANGPGDQGSISGRVRPKTQKVVLDNLLA